MFKKLTKTVVVLSALILLLAGCGSADPEPAVATPPPDESAVQQEPEVVVETPEPAVVEEWITITNPQGEFTLSIPASWSYDYDANNVWINIVGEVGGVELLFEADTMNLDPFEFESSKEESVSWDYFQFDDGHLGYVIISPTSIWWSNNAMPRHMHLTLNHGGDMSIFTDNEDLILRIARSLTSALPNEITDDQQDAQIAATPAGIDIDNLALMLTSNEWRFQYTGNVLDGWDRFFFIDFFGDGIGELSDYPGIDVADFTWALIDDAENSRVVLNIFSVWLDPVAAHAGLWYEVSLSTVGAQQTLTLQGFDTSDDTVVITGW